MSDPQPMTTGTAAANPGAGASAVTPRPAPRNALPIWLDRCTRFLARSLIVAGSFPVVITSYLASARLGVAGLVAMIVLTSLVMLSTVAIHEFGHAIAGRLAGMKVLRIQVGVLEFRVVRGGFRVRLRRSLVRAGGHAYAIADPDRPFRPQLAMMTLGGPLANLAAATLAIVAFKLIGQPEVRAIVFGAAAFNLAMGIANLIPFTQPLASDGLILLGLRMPIDVASPEHVYARIEGRLLNGTLASALPEADLEALGQMPLPMPLIQFWYRAKAAQERGDWAAVAGIARGFEASLANCPAVLRSALFDFIQICRHEFAFSSAMAQGRWDDSAPAPLGDGARWYAEHLPSRSSALRHALAGKRAECEHQLATSAGLVERSIDLSLHESERRIRAAIAALLPA